MSSDNDDDYRVVQTVLPLEPYLYEPLARASNSFEHHDTDQQCRDNNLRLTMQLTN